MSILKHLLGAAALTAALVGTTAGAVAQGYPERPVTVIVPFAAGGGTDVYTRIWAEEMSKLTGQRFIVENMPGAAGAIGTKAGIASTPDGYTLVMGVASTIAINPHTMGAEIGYKSLEELRPISLLVFTPWYLVGSTKNPYDDIDGMLEHGKENPGDLTFGTWTSTGETGRKILVRRTGVDLLPVPYDGAVAAMNDLVAGRAAVAMTDLSSAVSFIRSGDIVALAVTGPNRSSLTPDVPAISESGVTDMDVNSWVALFAPAGTPDDIIALLNEKTTEVLSMPDVQAKLTDLAAEIHLYSPEETRAFVTTQYENWAKVIAETADN